MTDPPDEAERIQASSRGDANERVAVVATLKPGSRERAGAILAQGPPYGIDRAGFRRHSVFLAEETVVFMFEGPGIERLIRVLVNDPADPAGSAYGHHPWTGLRRLRGKSSTGRPIRQSDLGQRSPRKLLRALVARLLGRMPGASSTTTSSLSRGRRG